MDMKTLKSAAGRMKAKEMFLARFGETKNALTPEVLRYGMISRTMACELSSGPGPFGKILGKLWGLTILNSEVGGGIFPEHALSKSFKSKAEMETYLEGLREVYG